MVMLILEIMVPRLELEGIYVACANVSDLPLTVQNLASSVNIFYSRLGALEATAGLEVGGGAALHRNKRGDRNRRNGENGSGGNGGGEIVDTP